MKPTRKAPLPVAFRLIVSDWLVPKTISLSRPEPPPESTISTRARLSTLTVIT